MIRGTTDPINMHDYKFAKRITKLKLHPKNLENFN